MTAGYSGKPLVQKLGIKDGFRIAIVNGPEGYPLDTLPRNVSVQSLDQAGLALIHFFTKERQELEKAFPSLKRAMSMNGMLWISWPKGASRIETDLNENVVREIGLRHKLVDVKVIAVDETWSGLKFVYRTEDRKK